MAHLSELYSLAYGLVNAVLLRLEFVGEILLIYAVLEMLIPRRARNSWQSYLRSAFFWTVAIGLNLVAFSILDMSLGNPPEALLVNRQFPPNQVSPLTVVDLSPLTGSGFLPIRILGWLIAAYGVGAVSDFFYYWLHRTQHAVPALWRLHRVHHSITELSATSSYHHVFEDSLQLLCVVLPTTLLVRFEGGAVPWLIVTIVSTHAYFIHSSARIDIGPLRYVIADNRFHRIHHSREPRHFDKNFGTISPVWDALFGTMYMPKPNEWPSVGLDDMAEPRRVRDYLASPFVEPPPPKGSPRNDHPPMR